MKEEVYVPDPLNEQASVLVDAQTDIKTAIKQGVLSGKGKETIKKEIGKIIDRAIARIRSPTLKEDGRISLMRFADKAYARFVSDLATIPPTVITSVLVLMRAITAKESQGEYYIPKTNAERKAAQVLYYDVHNKGIPLNEFTKTYIERIDTALNNLAEVNALDPNDFTKRNSLRNLAEMQVRYERHLEEIAGFKKRGTRLVLCSSHADCSDRCARFQGRVYSLDGTEGDTEDGRHYVPLEIATDVYYTTKAGRTYKNGLLGFNCRHSLVEFKPDMAIPKLNAVERAYEYRITVNQRRLERDVIKAREKALEFKDTNIKEYRSWKKEAERRFELYKEYSKENSRAYYPDRVKIL